MAKQLKKIFERSTDEIVQGFTVQSWHVSQSVDALTGAEDYDITISGSLTVTGSVYLDGIDDAGGSDVYNIVINQNSGQIFTTASSYGPIPPSPPGQNGSSGSSGTSGNDGSSGTSGEAGSSGTSGDNGSSGTSGATGDPGTSGTSGTGGAGGGGSSGTSGNDGANGALVFPYTFQTSINNPPAGYFRLTSGLTTDILINNTDGTGTDISGFFDTIDEYGGDVKAILKLEKADDPTSFILYEITLVLFVGSSATFTSGFRIVTIVSGPSFSDGDDVLVSFSLIGPEGTSGTSGAGGSGSGGTAGSSGTSGNDGSSGTSGEAGSSGTSGNDGSSGTSGTTGTSGNGTDGTSGTTGTSGNGTDGTSGTGGAGSSGTSGTGGAGSSGTSGTTGTSGNGTAGTSGTNGNGDNWTSTPTDPVSSGINVGDQHLNTSSGDVFSWTGTIWSSSGNIKGPSGSSGTSGEAGSSGTSGDNGSSGTSGSSGSSGTSGASNTWTSSTSLPNPIGSYNVGDQYLRTSTGVVYEWNGSNWITKGNIKGPSGSSGTSGAGSSLTHNASTTSGSFTNVPTQGTKLPSGWISVTISGQIYYIPAYYEDL